MANQVGERRTKHWIENGCPKCGGDLYPDRDRDMNLEYRCCQCSFSDVKIPDDVRAEVEDNLGRDYIPTKYAPKGVRGATAQ